MGSDSLSSRTSQLHGLRGYYASNRHNRASSLTGLKLLWKYHWVVLEGIGDPILVDQRRVDRIYRTCLEGLERDAVGERRGRRNSKSRFRRILIRFSIYCKF